MSCLCTRISWCFTKPYNRVNPLWSPLRALEGGSGRWRFISISFTADLLVEASESKCPWPRCLSRLALLHASCSKSDILATLESHDGVGVKSGKCQRCYYDGEDNKLLHGWMWWAENTVFSWLWLSEQSRLCVGLWEGRPGFFEWAAFPQAVLTLSEALPCRRCTGPTGSPWLCARWAALGNCGFPELSALFAAGLPPSHLFSPAAWEAGCAWRCLLVGDILWASVGLLDTLLSGCRACLGWNVRGPWS